jgi:hypothetical protein
MESEGLIERKSRYNKRGGQDTNTYHFDGLIKTATPHAKEFVTMRDKQRTESAARRSRKRPRLVVDNTDGKNGKK